MFLYPIALNKATSHTLSLTIFMIKISKTVKIIITNKTAYGGYRQAKKEMQDILTAKENVDRLLELEKEEKTKEKTQEQR